MLSEYEIKGRKQKMIYLFRTIGVFKGTQLVALQTAIMLKENVRRKLHRTKGREQGCIWLQDVERGIRSTKEEK